MGHLSISEITTIAERNWGCRNCDAQFFKDTPRIWAALCRIVPHQFLKIKITSKNTGFLPTLAKNIKAK